MDSKIIISVEYRGWKMTKTKQNKIKKIDERRQDREKLERKRKEGQDKGEK